MNAKALARSICPPAIWALASRARGRKVPNSEPAFTSRFEGRFETFEEAAKSASPDYSNAPLRTQAQAPEGSPDITTIAEFERRLAVAFLYMSGRCPFRHFLDFGGSFGTHLATFRKLALPLPTRWDVVEIPSIVTAARAMPGIDPLLTFQERLPEAGSSPDVVLASGVLHLLHDPLSTFKALAALSPRFLFVDRQPLTSEARSFATLHNVDPVYFLDDLPRRIPVWFFARSHFLAMAADCGLDLIWEAPTASTYVIDGEAIPVSYAGLLFGQTAKS